MENKIASYGDLREWISEIKASCRPAFLASPEIHPVTETTGTLSFTVKGKTVTSPVATLTSCERVKTNWRKRWFYI